MFSHPDADARFGASVFWVRQGMLPEDGMREFLVTWQIANGATTSHIEDFDNGRVYAVITRVHSNAISHELRLCAGDLCC